MSLPERLEQAAEALPDEADAIRPANGDPRQLLTTLDAAGAARVLAWLLEHAPEEGAELALAWLEEPDGDAIVTTIDEGALPKPGRKALRRVLHAARSRGLAAPRAGATASKVSRLPEVDQPISAAYVSPLDPRGARLVYLVESSPGGGARVFETLIDDERGIVDFQVYKAGRRQVRDFIRDVTGRKGGYAAVETDVAAVRALLARAAARHPTSRPFPKPFTEWRSRLTREGEGAATPGEQVRAALEGSAAEADAIDRLAHAARARSFGPWPPAADALETVVRDLRARAEAEPDGAPEGYASWARDAIVALYAGVFAPLMAERFEECAYVFWRRGEEDLARACLATAGSLRDGRGAEAPAVGALGEVIADALAADWKQSLGAGAGEGADAESTGSDG